MPKAVIADSGPLIALSKIHKLDLIPQLFTEILIPPEVWNEITVAGSGLPGADEIRQAKWITIQSPNSELVKPLNILLDVGESEAIALAQIIPDSLLLLDDSRARTIAARLNVKQLGTIGILLRAKRMKLIDKIKPYLYSLQENGVYIRQKLIDAVLKETGEQ